MGKKKLSVIIPVYNTAATLIQLVGRLSSVLNAIDEVPFEIIFIDDGSSDQDTWPTLVAIAEENKDVKIIRLTKNYGQQAATICGMAQSTGEHVITMDDDLQHAPEDIPKLLAERHHDVVLASFQIKRHGFMRRVFSRIKDMVFAIALDKPKGIQTTSFRLINRAIVDAVVSIKSPYPYIALLLSLVTKDFVNVQVLHNSRAEGKSGYTVAKLFHLLSHVAASQSSLLWNFVGYIGLACFALSVFMIIYIIFRVLFGSASSLYLHCIVVVIGFLGGLTLMCLGMMGAYLHRVAILSEQRPSYVIREVRAQ
ncbi:MAG: glycosyltransferase family 2 protein [Deltaproteobacteria bacterium]|nr:glycosyltransferase family 2 protein [Deltaproteobacteria bacterium]